jgi:hypothetical protein
MSKTEQGLREALAYAKGEIEGFHVTEVDIHRREKPGFDRTPIPNAVDYSTALSAIKTSVAILSESIENRQKMRTEDAMSQLELGTKYLKLWLKQKGLNV